MFSDLWQGLLFLSKSSGDSEYLPYSYHNYLYIIPLQKLNSEDSWIASSLSSRTSETPWSMTLFICPTGHFPTTTQGMMRQYRKLKHYLLHCSFFFILYSFNFNLFLQKVNLSGFHLYITCTVGFSKGMGEENLFPNYAVILHFPALAKCKHCGLCSPHLCCTGLLFISPPFQRRQWHPTPVLLPGKRHGWRSLGGCSPWDL